MGVHGIPEAVHADRGTSMTSKPVAQLLLDLGVDRSHSRPRVSNDNPFSEAAFKTLKYAPASPESFGSLADARAFCEAFFNYYHHEHRHSGIGLHTPASVHHGTATEIRTQRQATLDAAHTTHPERFGNRRPLAPKLPEAAWINQPSLEALIQTRNETCLRLLDIFRQPGGAQGRYLTCLRGLGLLFEVDVAELGYGIDYWPAGEIGLYALDGHTFVRL